MAPDPSFRIRMFNACLACSRQYDVSHLEPGGQVRCECGVTFRAEFRTPHNPRALKCSNCGGMLEEHARDCGYCGAQITLEERHLSAVCPGCFARMSTEARFCMECGIAIEVQALAALPPDARCPRCESGLRTRSIGSSNVSECEQCGGLWLTEEHFATVCERSDEQELASRALTQSAPPTRAPDKHKVRYLPCVVCKDLMSRRNYSGRSGIIIDVCREHGIWLDHTELEGILSFIRGGGLDRAREAQLERLKRQEQRTRASRHTSAGESAAPFSQHRSARGGLTLGTWVEWALDGLL
jgi:Zn-finger nucleic acid-binding protein/DNA-directed RNA polymerase subunit RPC12/RpoP